MTVKEYEYLKQLKQMSETLTEPYANKVFYIVCRAYQEYKYGNRGSKAVTKSELLKRLVEAGLQVSGKSGQLPDDRRLRETCRELLSRGYPIVASSKSVGYFIAESVSEIDEPQRENHNRAVSILAVDQGYQKVRRLLSGQMSVFGG